MKMQGCEGVRNKSLHRPVANTVTDSCVQLFVKEMGDDP